MPMYTWVEKKSGARIEVIRPAADYEKPPTEAELSADKIVVPEDPQWTREIGANQSLFRGAGWRGMKGYWLIWLALGLSGCIPIPVTEEPTFYQKLNDELIMCGLVKIDEGLPDFNYLVNTGRKVLPILGEEETHKLMKKAMDSIILECVLEKNREKRHNFRPTTK